MQSNKLYSMHLLCYCALKNEVLVLLSAQNDRLQFILSTRRLLYRQTCLEEKGKLLPLNVQSFCSLVNSDLTPVYEVLYKFLRLID